VNESAALAEVRADHTQGVVRISSVRILNVQIRSMCVDCADQVFKLRVSRILNIHGVVFTKECYRAKVVQYMISI